METCTWSRTSYQLKTFTWLSEENVAFDFSHLKFILESCYLYSGLRGFVSLLLLLGL